MPPFDTTTQQNPQSQSLAFALTLTRKLFHSAREAKWACDSAEDDFIGSRYITGNIACAILKASSST